MSTLHKDISACYWCGEIFKVQKGTQPEDGLYTEEVGEFWNKDHQDSVLGHPDCSPMGVEAILSGEDPVWMMA
jgi:hypothetical protein